MLFADLLRNRFAVCGCDRSKVRWRQVRGFSDALDMSGRYSATIGLHLSEPWRFGIGNSRATDGPYSSLRLLSPSFDNDVFERLYASTSQAQMYASKHHNHLTGWIGLSIFVLITRL